MDPRTIRTRQLIVDSFHLLIRTTDFSHISVKMITEAANINRATFYAHFVDKYELLDVVLHELMEAELAGAVSDVVGELLITELFTSIAHVHDKMHSGCRKGYDSFASMIEDVAKESMKDMLKKALPHADNRQLQMMSWAIYGAFVEWQHARRETLEQAARETAALLQPMLIAIKQSST